MKARLLHTLTLGFALAAAAAATALPFTDLQPALAADYTQFPDQQGNLNAALQEEIRKRSARAEDDRGSAAYDFCTARQLLLQPATCPTEWSPDPAARPGGSSVPAAGPSYS